MKTTGLAVLLLGTMAAFLESQPPAPDDADHPMRAHVLRAIAEALAGCRAIVCAQIGQGPQQEMERLGLETFVAGGPIKPTLIELAKLL